jgi:hypothetical protein
MVNTVHTQTEHNVFEPQSSTSNVQQLRSNVWQDKHRPTRDRIASHQPAPHVQMMRPHEMNRNTSRSRKKPIPKRKTVHLSLWVKPVVKAELERIAASEEISISATGGTLLEKALQGHVDMQYGALLRPIIEQAVRQELRSFSNRIVFFLMRIAFSAEQGRILITNVLDRMSEVTQESFTTIIDKSHTTARKNVIQKTPQIKTLLEEWEQSTAKGGKESETNNV